MTNETFWAYFAGFLDADGCIILKQGKYPGLAIANTNLEVLQWFQDTIGYGHINTQDKSNKPTHQYKLASNGMRVVLPKVIPYLKVKKKKAELMVAYMEVATISSSQDRSEEKLAKQEALRQSFLEEVERAKVYA